jgi:hypothetical protein
MRSPLCGHLVPQRRELVRCQIRDEAFSSELGSEQRCRVFVVRKSVYRQLASFQQRFLGGQEGEQKCFDRQRSRIGTRLAAGVQVVLLRVVVVNRGVGVVNRPEVVQLSPDFLAPTAGRVRGKWEVGIGLGRLGWTGRMLIGHGDNS